LFQNWAIQDQVINQKDFDGFVNIQLTKSINKKSKTNHYELLLENTNTVLEKIKRHVNYYDLKYNLMN